MLRRELVNENDRIEGTGERGDDWTGEGFRKMEKALKCGQRMDGWREEREMLW